MSQFKHVRTLKAKRRERILPALIALHEAGTSTAEEIGVYPSDIKTFEGEGLVKRVGKRQTGTRGRPAIEYRLTDKGVKRARRAAA